MNAQVWSDFGDSIQKAFFTKLRYRTGGRHVENNDIAGFPDFVDDILRTFGTHPLVIAGNAVYTVDIDHDIEVYDNDALCYRPFNRHFHTRPLRKRDDCLSAPQKQIVKLRRHLFAVGTRVEFIHDFIGQRFTASFRFIGYRSNPTVRNGRRENTDFVLLAGSRFRRGKQ